MRVPLRWLLGLLPFVSILAFVFASAQFASAQSREAKVLGDKRKFESLGLWYYNDLDSAFVEAAKSEKPLMVVLRCIPCEECVKLDDDLVEADPAIQQLMKSFVRVRIVGTNGLDLSLFEFDTDQSFGVFFFNADRTLYGRYGTRSDRTQWQKDVSVEGLGKALQVTLKLHRNYPANRVSLLNKQPKKPLFASPEKIPALASKYTGKIDYEGNVVKSCIHCHQIGDAMREYYHAQDAKLPESLLFPYPHPKTIGLILDPKECATVESVVDASAAKAAGFQKGDRIELLAGQPMLSFADVQWVLNSFPSDGGQMVASVTRGNETIDLNLKLDSGWRTREDIGWRASTWGLRRIGLGGMFLKPVSDDMRASLGIASDKMALVVEHVGAFAPHDRAKQAGVLKGDVLVDYDGRRDLLRETDVLAYAINQVEKERSVPMRFFRGSQERAVEIATAK
ncbi:MAG: thioredoxin family protein [Pirellula sp.]|nr:thioredoxin family protein [Pirellula sp.]